MRRFQTLTFYRQKTKGLLARMYRKLGIAAKRKWNRNALENMPTEPKTNMTRNGT